MARCLQCGRAITLRHPAQKFCSPGKSGRRKCKDRYNNARRARETDPRSDLERYLDSVHPFSEEALQP